MHRYGLPAQDDISYRGVNDCWNRTAPSLVDSKHRNLQQEGKPQLPGMLSESQSSKRSKKRKATNTTSVASAVMQAADVDDDVEMIAEELLREKEQYIELMKRYMNTRRELYSAKARNMQLEQQTT